MSNEEPEVNDQKPAEEQSADVQPQERKNLLVPNVERWPTDSDRPIIELRDVHKSFGKDHVLKGLSLRVMAGQITIIIGASGSGKSVLIKHMNGLLRPDRGCVEIFGQSVAELNDTELSRVRKRVGTMFQNYALFDSLNVVENVAFPLFENAAMSQKEANARAATLLEELGLGEALTQFPATLSGGMKKRVSLARAIIANPEVVLFDEPTTGLDPVMMEFVDNMISDITKKYGLTSVIISHDLATIFRLADSIAVLHGGQIIAQGPPEEIRESDDERVMELLRGANKTDIEHGAASSAELGDEERVVKISGLSKSFGELNVLKGVDLAIPKHKIVVLIGGSGSGKSVLMKHILGLMRPDSGKVEVFGTDLATMGEKELRHMRTRIGMLFQHAALFDSLNVRDNIAFPLVERRVASTKEAHKRTDALLERLKLTEIADANTTMISSGQQKRVSLARALITEPNLMIYDEPTTGQDPLMSKYVEDMIMEVHESFDVTSVVISHDMASAFRTADFVAMLYHGEIIAFGPPSTLLDIDDERVHDFVHAATLSQEKRESEGG